MLCVAIVFVLGAFDVFTDEILSSLVIQIMIMFAMPFLMYTIFVTKNAKKTFADAGFKKISCKVVVISFLLGITLYCVNSFVATAFQNLIALFGYESISAATSTPANFQFFLKEFVLSTILPGFCEEFLHRGLLLNANRQNGNTRYCLIISSLLFGLMHLNITQFFYAAILGALMGYVVIKSGSIFPSMIIHFSNNFLSSYFYYGPQLKWPLAMLINEIKHVLFSNLFVFIICAFIGVWLLILLYLFLIKIIIRDKAKSDLKIIVNNLQTNNLSFEEAQAEIDKANMIVKKSNKFGLENDGKKLGFTDCIFTICAFVLGGLITICSFVWGII